ncbi:MAG TPA: ABC transporter permease [Chloroflexota bacterium]|nr:ABC transporter permease [Chloroflexota bacterium]
MSAAIARVLEYRRLLVVVVLAVALWLARAPLLWLGAEGALEFGRLVQALISLPLPQRFPGFWYMNQDWPQIAALFGEHLKLSAEAVGIALAIAVPLGIIVHRLPWLNFPVMGLFDAVYVLPSLAVFPALIPHFGLSETTVLIGLVAYAQFILVRNVVVGLQGVPEESKESARGMGMNPLQVLVRVEIPLALPIVMAGLRIATVSAIAVAAVAGLVGIPDLGTILFEGATAGTVNSNAEIEAGAIAVTALALGADVILRLVEYNIPANRVARAGRSSAFNRAVRSLLLSHAAADEASFQHGG